MTGEKLYNNFIMFVGGSKNEFLLFGADHS